MRRILFASHGRFAAGMLDTLEMIVGQQAQTSALCAYTSECPDPKPVLAKIVDGLPQGDELVIVTDVFGGSVNTEASQYRNHSGVLHGQVVFSWCTALNPDCILVANDDVVKDELRKTTLKLGKPANTKLVIKGIDDSIAAINAGKTDKYRLFAVVSNVADAVRMATSCDQISEIDLGGTKATPGTRPVSKMVNLTDEEEAQMKRELEEIDFFRRANVF